jgi:hypothetical protein
VDFFQVGLLLLLLHIHFRYNSLILDNSYLSIYMVDMVSMGRKLDMSSIQMVVEVEEVLDLNCSIHYYYSMLGHKVLDTSTK